MNSLHGAPYYYDYMNQTVDLQMPSTVHVTNTRLSGYFIRYLLQKVMSVFEWKLPETWAEDYFKYVLYCWGYIAVVNTDKYGVICQQCGLRGYDVFYRPTNAVITNPLINRTLEPRIGKQCTLIKLQPDYGGIMDLVTYYGDLMALTAEAVAVTALNVKSSYVFAASSPSIAQSIKKMYDNFASGEPATVVDKKLFTQDGKIMMEALGGREFASALNDILLALHTVENMFDKDIGLPVLPSMKKERDLVDEVEGNKLSSVSKIGMWLDEIKKSCEETNDMFNLDIRVKWRVPPRVQEKGTETVKKQEGVQSK